MTVGGASYELLMLGEGDVVRASGDPPIDPQRARLRLQLTVVAVAAWVVAGLASALGWPSAPWLPLLLASLVTAGVVWRLRPPTGGSAV